MASPAVILSFMAVFAFPASFYSPVRLVSNIRVFLMLSISKYKRISYRLLHFSGSRKVASRCCQICIFGQFGQLAVEVYNTINPLNSGF